MATPCWLSEEHFARLQPLLPTKVRGVPRVDDRRVISGILHVLQSGCRWRDAPAVAQFNEPLVSVITLETISCPGSCPGWVSVCPVPARAWEAGEVVASYLALQASLMLYGVSC